MDFSISFVEILIGIGVWWNAILQTSWYRRTYHKQDTKHKGN